MQSGHVYFIAVAVVDETHVSHPPLHGSATTVSSSRDNAKRGNMAELLESKIRGRKSHMNHKISKPSKCYKFSISLRTCFRGKIVM